MALWPLPSPGQMTWLYDEARSFWLYASNLLSYSGLNYYAPLDIYVLWVMMEWFEYNYYAPQGMYRQATYRIALDAETGLITGGEGTTSINLATGLFGFLGSGNWEVCTYNKLFGAAALQTTWWGEMDIATNSLVPGGWSITAADLPYWPPGWWFTTLKGIIVNLADDIMVQCLFASDGLRFWNNIKNPDPNAAFMGLMDLPGEVYDLAYVDRECLWVAMQGGYLMKINYQLLRVEGYAQLPPLSGEEEFFKIAWDSRRSRLAAFRYIPDDPETGECRSRLEFYRPIPKPAILTAPAPIRALRAGREVPLVYHLVGSAGEATSPYLVQGALTEPASGQLAGMAQKNGAGGMGLFMYAAPAVPGGDTLTLTAAISDGDQT